MRGERVAAEGMLPLAMGLLADVAALGLVLAMANALMRIGDTLQLHPVLIAALDGLAVIGLWASTRRYRVGRSASFAAVCLAPVMVIEIARLNLQPGVQADLLGYVLEWTCLGVLFGDILANLGMIAVRRMRHSHAKDVTEARPFLWRLDA